MMMSLGTLFPQTQYAFPCNKNDFCKLFVNCKTGTLCRACVNSPLARFGGAANVDCLW